MNPRIEENMNVVYQKEPDDKLSISPNFTSFPKRKTLEPSNESLIFFPSMIAEKTWENVNELIKIDSQISKEKLEPANFQDSEIIKAERIPKIKKKTFLEFFSKFYLIKKFTNILKRVTLNRTPKFQSKENFNIINDLVFFSDVWKQNELKLNEKSMSQKTLFLENLNKKTSHFFENFQVFDNSSIYMIIWNLFHLLFILYFFFTIPLEVCFDVKFNHEAVYYFQYIAGYFFLGDILINFNTAVYLKGKLIKTRHKIVKNYIKTNFLKDIISILSIFMQIYKNKSNDLTFSTLVMILFQILFFLRMRNFSSILKNLEEMFFIGQSLQNTLSLWKLIFRIVLLSHIFACFWFYIGTLSDHNSWIIHSGIMSEPWWNKYIYSFYYVCITMNPVGSGDIVPQNSIEKVFTIIFIYIACGIFAYSINKIGIIVSENAKRENEFQRDLNIINEFMQNKEIYFDLRMRVRKYFEYIWYEEKVEKLDEQSIIIGKLSDSLKEELLLEANSSILRNLKMFSFNFSEDFLRNTISLLKEVRFTPGDIIFKKGDNDNKSIYIIRKGKVEIFLETNKINAPDTVLKSLQKGETFGEISFFSDQERSACVRSINFTSAYMIKKEDFVRLLKKYPRDYQKFCEIKDSINLYEDYKQLYIKCYSCNQIPHLIQNCPNILYKPIKDILLNRYFFSLDQVRIKFERKNHRFHALKKKILIQEKALDLQYSLFPLVATEESLETEGDYYEQKEVIDNSAFHIKNIKQEKDEFAEEKKEKENEDSSKKYGRTYKINNYHQGLYKTEEESEKNEDSMFKTLDYLETEIKNAWFNESSKNLSHLEKIESLKIQKKSSKETIKLKSLINFFSEFKEGKLELSKTKEENRQKNEKELLPIICQEIVRSWDFYFPYNNCENTIENCNHYNYKMNRARFKRSSTKTIFSNKAIRCIFSRRPGLNKNLEKSPSSKQNALLRTKSFFKNSHEFKKFLEPQFDTEKIKKLYQKENRKKRMKLFLSQLVWKLFRWRIFQKKKKSIKGISQ